MRLTLFPAMLAAISLAACAPMTAAPGSAAPPPGGVYSPSTYADRTIADETAALAFEQGVELAADLGTLAVQTGKVKGANLDRLKRATAVARIAVAGVRSAYASGNSANISDAITNARASINAVRAIAKGESN
jgi:hypothetical protein